MAKPVEITILCRIEQGARTLVISFVDIRSKLLYEANHHVRAIRCHMQSGRAQGVSLVDIGVQILHEAA
jgi:hypothetical protein